jgi:hypothetical protein
MTNGLKYEPLYTHEVTTAGGEANPLPAGSFRTGKRHVYLAKVVCFSHRPSWNLTRVNALL